MDLELSFELDDTGSNFDQAQPQGIELHNSPSRTFGQDAAHRPQEPIGASVQEQAKLIGLGRMAGGAVGGEVVLPRLDVVLGLAAGAVEPLVKVLGAAAFKVGDNKAGVGAFGPRFDAGDDALDPAPAPCGIVELGEAAPLAAGRHQLEAFGSAFLQCHDMAAESHIGGQTEDPIDPVRPTPVEHLRGRIMTVGAQQDFDLGPMGSDGANEAAHKAANLHSAWPLAWPQQNADKAALAIEHNDRLEAVIVMVGIEQAKLLTAVYPVERIVDIEHNTLRHRPERATVLVNQGPAEAQQRPPIGQIFQT